MAAPPTLTALVPNDIFYPALIESLPVAIYTCDEQGYITHFNAAAAELWGRKPEKGIEQYTGAWKVFRLDGSLLPKDQSPMAISIKQKRELNGQEIIIERPDGTRRFIQTNPRPIVDSSENFAGAVSLLIDVTTTKVIHQERERLSAIIQGSEDAIISKTLDGIITSWNPSAEKLFGYTESEMIGQPIMKLIPPELSNEETVIIERLKRGERVEHFETKRISKTGELLDISLTISPVRNNEGIIVGASKIARNITNQKRLNEALRESNERFRMAIESTGLGTWELQPLTDKLTWSEECCKIFDVPFDKKVNFSFFSDCIYSEDREFVQNEIQKALNPSGNGQLNTEYRIKRFGDGQVRWIKAQGKAYFNQDNQPLRFIGTALDITQQKKEEQQLKESVELFQTMADNVPAMIWMSGKDKFNDYFNKAWLEFSGRTQEQESSEGWLQGVHPDDKEKCNEVYKNALRDKKGFYSEYRLRRYDGQYRWIADNCVPRLAPTGEFAGFISACIDIDDQKRLEQRKDDFIKMASHELKTPITSIKGYVQLLLAIYEEMNDEKMVASKGTVKSSLSTVSKQITKLTRLISDLLDMSRIETGKLDLNYSEFDPVLLVEETVQDVRHTSSRHKIIIHNKFEGTLEADRDRISQVLVNLLTNAIKYSPSTDTIDLFIAGDKNSIAVSVADYGIGINKNEQSRIFERFYRVEGKNELTYPGFGIGLFIASEIVHRHQGTIQVKSEKDKGSVFTFTLPLIPKNNVNE
jgi:PAS domain S-box-containing protein